MTNKQIADAVGKAEKTVRTWASKTAAKSAVASAKLAEAQRGGGKPADWTLEETCAIIETGMGRNAADLFRMSANRQPVAPQSDIAAIVRETMTAMVPALIAIMRGAIPEQKALALPAASDISARDSIRKLVNQYGRKINNFSMAWGELYQQFYYRYHINIRERAKNRHMDVLDYAEADGLIDDLLALAVSLYGVAA